MLAQATPTTFTIAWIVIAAIVLAFIVARILARRGERGGDGDAAVTASRDRAADASTAGRASRLAIVALTPGARTRYAGEWKTLQTNFVDAPGETIAQADRLVENIMRDRGFPVDDFDARAGDFGDAFQPMVDDYRAAHTVALRNRKGAADTEALRQAMVSYRALVARLLERG